MVNDSTVVVFDDERAVANAGVMLPGCWPSGSVSSSSSTRRCVSVIVPAAPMRVAR
jgi:hypothetical protein